MTTISTRINALGNGLAVRLTQRMAEAAGMEVGTPVRVIATPGRIAIEVDAESTLDLKLAAFDPMRHGGELMADAPVGSEVGAAAGSTKRHRPP